MLRFSNLDVLQNLDGVLTELLRRIEGRAPHPSPLPSGERGLNEATDPFFWSARHALKRFAQPPERKPRVLFPPPFRGEGWGEGLAAMPSAATNTPTPITYSSSVQAIKESPSLVPNEPCPPAICTTYCLPVFSDT